MELKLELVLLPVADVDRAKAFYERLGFTLDVDHDAGEDFRIVQFTAPGSVRGLHLVVADVVAAREELVGRGVAVAEIRHMTSDGWAAGPHPQREDYNSFAEFSDPDGNAWVLQEVRRGGAAG